MEFRNLGDSGLKVSVAGVGCNNFGMTIEYEASEKVVRAALEAGINFFDTADCYGAGGSEQHLGRALGADRQNVVISTKFGVPMGRGPLMGGASRRYVMQACEASLKRSVRTTSMSIFCIRRIPTRRSARLWTRSIH